MDILQTRLKAYDNDNKNMTLLLGTYMALGMHKSQLILSTSVNYTPQSAQSFAVGIFYEGSRPTPHNPLRSTENTKLCHWWTNWSLKRQRLRNVFLISWGMKQFRGSLLPFSFFFNLEYSGLNWGKSYDIFSGNLNSLKAQPKCFVLAWSDPYYSYWLLSLQYSLYFWDLCAGSTICCNYIHANQSKLLYSKETNRHTSPPPRNLSRLGSSSYL